jgi:hypothetical protein
MKTSLIIITSFILLFVFTVAADANIYWVSPTGKATWVNSKSQTPLNGTSACSLSTANINSVAGDTIILRTGSYSTYIVPAKSGTVSNRIIYKNYDTETVTIQNTNYGILLDGKSYINVQGINFYNLDRFMYLQNGANYNIIAYCKFDLGRHNSWTGSIINKSSSYNWIHHCSFSNYGECIATYASGSDQGTNLDIGDEESGTDASQYNVIEESTFYHAGHHVMGVFSKYNTIRNNYFHNEAWSNGRGHRNLYLQGYATNSGYTLFEGNRFGYSSRSCNNQILTPASVTMTTSNNIFRYNKIFHSIAAGMSFGSYVSQGAQYSIGSYNNIYSNTIFNSGYNIDPSFKGTVEDASIFFSNKINTGNQFKNNLFSANFQPYGGSPQKNQFYANNWNGDKQGDPMFVNASTTPPADKFDTTLPNLDLLSTSLAIDKGGALTTITSATGSGNSLMVANASCLQDGTWGPPGVIQADWIAVGTVENSVQISSISGNTIHLENSIKWENGESVWLYKKSDGVQVLYGIAPDAGAYEYNAVTTQNESIKSINKFTIYPNPFSERTTINFTNIVRSATFNLSLHLYNLMGKEVAVFNNISTDNFILEKSNLAEGMYLYRVMNNKENIGSGKLMVK